MNALWKVPGEAMKLAAGSWQVKSERGLGAAQAVLAPLRQSASGQWRLATAQAALPLTPVCDAHWTDLAALPEAEATHHLCLLRYDHPADRPGAAYRMLLDPQALLAQLGNDGAQRDAASVTAPGGMVSAHELQQVLADQVARHGERLRLYMVAASSPRRSDAGLSFAFASCQYPAGLLDRRVAHASYRTLARYLADPARVPPERLLLLGDQVYADATYGLLDPVRLDDRYRFPYEALKDREAGPMAGLPQDFLARVRMTPDDHEIVNDWEPAADGVRDEAFEHAMEAFWLHQRQGDRRRRGVQLRDQGPGWWLFMADTRTQRERRTEANVHAAQLLGRRQAQHLLAWLRTRPEQDLKIVTSPGMLLPRTRFGLDEPLLHDGWQGFPASLHGLLAFLCDRQLRNVVFLSGDAHVGCSAQVTVRNLGSGASVRFASLHTPALYAPYPFGNETRWNLLLQDRFRFHAPGGAPAGYECVVEAEMVDDGRQGCGLLHAKRAGGGWDLAFEVLQP
jgi:hypothetical protein